MPHLCEHPNEVPHTCICVVTCYCRSTTCPLTLESATRAQAVLQELGKALVQAASVPEDPPKEGLFIVRLFDMLDGWIDCSKPLSKKDAEVLWNQKTLNGTRKTQFADGDYYRIFPADTRMLVTPDPLGRCPV